MAEDRVRQRGVDVVVVVRRLVVRVRILRGDAKLDPVHRDELDRERALRLVIDIGSAAQSSAAERPVFVIVASVHVIRHAGRPTADASRVCARIAGLEQPGRERLRDHLVGLQRLAVEGAQLRHRRHVEPLGEGLGTDRIEGVRLHPTCVRHVAPGGVVRKPLLSDEVPPWRSPDPLLGEDLDHAGRRFSAVQGGRGRSFQDFDVVDRLGVDVVQPRRSAAAARADPVGVAEPAPSIHPHAVDVHDRLIRLREARGAADPDLRTFAGEAAGGEYGHGGVAGGELLRDVDHGRVAQLRSVNRADGVAKLALLRFRASAGHDHDVESHGGATQLEIGVGDLAGGRRDLPGSGRVPDAPRPQLHIPGAYRELVAALPVRERPEVGTRDIDAHTIDRSARERVDHRAANRPRPLGVGEWGEEAHGKGGDAQNEGRT